MNKLIMTAALTTTVAIADAKNIDGLFGYKLGEKFIETSEKFRRFEKKTIETSYTPTIISYGLLVNDKPFKEYSIIINPQNNKITSIYGLGYFETQSGCFNEMKKQRNIFKQNKGMNFKYNSPSDILSYYSWVNGRREMKIECIGDRNPVMFTVGIFDKDIEKTNAPKITGAFGFKFGERLDLSRKDYTVVESSADGMPISVDFYENLQHPFSYYRVLLNPKNTEIYAIGASADYDTVDECLEDMVAYGKTVEDKYHKMSEYSKENETDSLLLTQDDKVILMSCNSSGKYIMVYTDMTRKQDAMMESSIIKSKKIDRSLF